MGADGLRVRLRSPEQRRADAGWTAAGIRTRTLRAACAGGLLAFVALTGAAAWRYPGGTWWDRRATGYSLSQNFLCDLFHRHALNGRDNSVSASLATAGAVSMLGAMASFFSLIARLEPVPSRGARWARALGWVSCALGLAIPLTPSDRHRRAHLAVMLAISLPALGSLALAARVCVRVRAQGPWARAASGFAMTAVTFASLDALAYALATQTRALDLWLAPTQRLAMLATLAWVAAVIRASGERAANACEDGIARI